MKRFGWSIDEIVCRFSQAKVTLMAQMWEMGGVDSSHCCKLHLLAGKHLQQVFKNHKESGIKKHHQQTYHTGPNWFFSYIVLHISIPRTEDDPCPPPSLPSCETPVQADHVTWHHGLFAAILWARKSTTGVLYEVLRA